MSQISRYYQEIQESEDYRSGWESAERGEPRPNWKPIPGCWETRLERQRIGWEDYHAGQRKW